MVVICFPPSEPTGTWHERVATPLMCTVQAPHCAMPQPYFVPVRPTFSRNAQSRGVLGSTSTLWVWPLIVRVGISFLPSCGCGSRGKPHAHSTQTTGKRRYSRGPFRLCLFGRGRRPAPRPPSRELDVVSLERERADALA